MRQGWKGSWCTNIGDISKQDQSLPIRSHSQVTLLTHKYKTRTKETNTCSFFYPKTKKQFFNGLTPAGELTSWRRLTLSIISNLTDGEFRRDFSPIFPKNLSSLSPSPRSLSPVLRSDELLWIQYRPGLLNWFPQRRLKIKFQSDFFFVVIILRSRCQLIFIHTCSIDRGEDWTEPNQKKFIAA
jgi:hypothetical protein